MIRRAWRLLFAAAIPLLALPAWADEAVRLRYRTQWGGLHAADIMFGLAETAGSYRTELEVATRGAVGWLVQLDFDAESAGRLAEAVTPLSYFSHYVTRRGERRIGIAFDPLTGLGSKTLDEVRDNAATHDDDPEQVRPIEPELRRGVVDPLGAFVVLRRRVAVGEKRFRIPVFDGRRRYDFDVEVAGRGAHDINGQRWNTVDVRLVMRPLAGFKPRHHKMWNGAVFDVFLDERLLLPLRIFNETLYAATVVGVVQTCPPAQGCELAERP